MRNKHFTSVHVFMKVSKKYEPILREIIYAPWILLEQFITILAVSETDCEY